MRRVLILLGVPIDDLSGMDEALDRLDEFIAIGRRTGKSHQVVTVNADFVVKAQKDSELRRILQEADLATADGMPLVWGAKLLGLRLAGRVTGADLVPALAQRAAQKSYAIYFLGAAPGVAHKAADRLRAEYPGLIVAGVHSPARVKLEDTQDEDLTEAIQSAHPDILLVAFGNPKQEKWIYRHARRLHVPVMIGVGGTFDFLAGITRRAPVWMQKSGLEWLFRLAQEPRRLWKRYVVDMIGFSRFYIRLWPYLRRRSEPTDALPASDAVIEDLGGRRLAILHIKDRLDAATVASFEEKAEAALNATACVIVEMQAAKFLDSRGIGCLVALAKRAKDAGGGLALAATPPPILKVLTLTKLERFLNTQPNIEAARASLYTSYPYPTAADAIADRR